MTRFLLSILLLLSSTVCASKANFDQLVQKMEDDVLALRKQVEDLYPNRCNLEECFASNFHECYSELPSHQCLSHAEYALPACGSQPCSALWDLDHSNIRWPAVLVDEDYFVSDRALIESTCFTRELDPYFRQIHDRDQEFWENKVNVRSPNNYFGSHTGSFRIYPGRQSRECGVYDPRLRPWYIAGSSGPKNVVLVLDTSGSMIGRRMLLLRKAAKQVISTLTVADRVAIITFSDVAIVKGDDSLLMTATAENKEKMLSIIDGLPEAIGATNIEDAFRTTFEVLENSMSQETTVSCNAAILFLTDGEPTVPGYLEYAERVERVIDLVNNNLGDLERRLGHPIFLFTYSVSEDAALAHELPRRLACEVSQGIWSKVVDDDRIIESLTSYYQLFTVGLGDGMNEFFTAWVEPFHFATGGVLGTTVSAPVFDRSKSPPVFLGVAGVDFPMAALDQALGVEIGSEETLKQVVLESTAFCPIINLSLCELESFRRRGTAGDDALCTNECGSEEFIDFEEKPCPNVGDYPHDLLANRNYKDLSYSERACCKIGVDEPTKECPVSESSNTGLIVGITIAGVAGMILVGYGMVCCCRERQPAAGKMHEPEASSETEIHPDPIQVELDIPIATEVVPAMNPRYHA